MSHELLSLEDAEAAIPSPKAVDGDVNGRETIRADALKVSISRLTRIAVLVFCALAIAYFARSVLVPVLLAWVGSLTLNSPVRWLGQCHLPTPVGAALVVAVFVLGIGYGGYHLGRPAIEWAKSAPENLPVLKEKLKRILAPAARLSAAASSVGQLESSDERSQKPQPVEVKDNHVAGSIFSWTGSMLAGVGETVALLFLLLASGDRFMQKLVEAMPTFRDKKQAVQISREIQQSISGYLFSVGLVNLTFGALVGLSLHVLGMPNAAMWGGMAACVNFIPYFGPIVGMVAVGMAGLLAFDTIGRGLLPAGAYLLLHLAEANLVTPFVLGHRCALNPVVIFVSLMFFGWLWGVAGALLAVPLLVTAKVVCDRIAVLSPLGRFLSS
jgi:predicted PurR-regulated permease PerM